MTKYRKPTKAIITDAGFASRFLPITKTIPKAMIPMGGKPVMQLCVEECVEGGIKEIIIVATPGTKSKEIYEDYFNNPAENVRKLLKNQGKSDRFKSVQRVLNFPKIVVIEQDPTLPYGNGSPIASAREFIDDDEAFVVLYSDDLIIGGQGDVATLIEAYAKNPTAKAIITAQEMPESEWNRYGMIALKDQRKRTLSHIVEKPKTPNLSPSSLTSIGRYLLTPEIFKYLLPKNTGLDDELWTVDAVTKLAKIGDVLVIPSHGKWVSTGDPKNYFLAQLEYVLMNEDYASHAKDVFTRGKW
ncbi:sugar phosphate nucleotidyltransferase [Candidatus Saccharibacteria bacterium]|nr:sugar phosphate nucleotidyltransferase [Candidatus Saccharibacteria bacterium]